MSETTFKMFIHKRDKELLVHTLEVVNAIKELSHKVGVKEHEVRWRVFTPDKPNANNSNSDHVWFEITVSRPFLIFIIGERYGLNRN